MIQIFLKLNSSHRGTIHRGFLTDRCHGHRWVANTHTHTGIPKIMGTFHRHNGFYTVPTIFSIPLHIFLFSVYMIYKLVSSWGPKKCPHKVRIYWYCDDCGDIWSHYKGKSIFAIFSFFLSYSWTSRHSRESK